jgi:cytochrome c
LIRLKAPLVHSSTVVRIGTGRHERVDYARGSWRSVEERFIMKRSAIVLAGVASLAFVGAAAAEDQPSLSAGKRIAAGQCGTCHAIDREGESPNPAAPRFRDLGARYPWDDLREALATGMIIGHPALMPKPALGPTQIGDLIAYMKSLQPRSAETQPGARYRPVE